MKTIQKSLVLKQNTFLELQDFIQANLLFEQIKHLNLDFENLNKDDFPIIASKIEKCSNLKYLSLNLYGQTQISKQLSILGASITKCKYLCALQMDLSQRTIGEKEGVVIASIIKGCKNLQIFNLFGWEVYLRGEGLSRIATAFSKCPKLTKLVISFVPQNTCQISDELLENLGSALVKCQKLQKLSISISNAFLSDNSLSILGFNLAKSVNLQILKINTYNIQTNTKLTSKGYYDLCISLSNLTNLKEFSLDFHWQLDGVCLSQVGLALQACKNLLKLSLSVHFELKDQHVEEFFFHIKNYRNLIQLDIFISEEKHNIEKIQRKILKMPRMVCYSTQHLLYTEFTQTDYLTFPAFYALEEKSCLQQQDSIKLNDSNEIDQINENNKNSKQGDFYVDNEQTNNEQEENSDQSYLEGFNQQSESEYNENQNLSNIEDAISFGDSGQDDEYIEKKYDEEHNAADKYDDNAMQDGSNQEYQDQKQQDDDHQSKQQQ
ncbi:hypothetical protein TTHERM_01399540 (macronuclear) [Tetrahymena thermophila SB210]|uniref:Kinase domain protein n=1 Tax=Tetrahymena thermophila (strain SB210) TaxID=312017 RepID=Q239H1_TETTS|nr:hypothetical protein TTHERM_01399540 [Tetrahymena thermophila SB210]EAR93172.2 hypothetical protein TTHERM_01399540 [Tetrahymena thermophila SB210]|eukprot:XP_001013417.2 hypothetical protein TTHERM_01399540 [Tetrahymena thermophila SB210]